MVLTSIFPGARSELTATFELPHWIAEGLGSGAYERIGGVILNSGTKQVVAWLREASSISPQGFGTGVLNLFVSGVNTAVSVKGFADVKQQLGGIEQNLQHVKRVMQVSAAPSVLNLGVSVMGFALVMQRLNELEQRLKISQELLNKVNRKIDIGYYANFKAAVGLAVNAFHMTKAENRERMAIEAINRFLEAEHIYTDYTESELKQGSLIAHEYLLTLSLAYVAEARCHLELGEPDTALHRFTEGASVLRSFIEKYVELLLTSNPAAYLQPQFKGKIDLHRLTRIYQWIDPSLDENAVFELQRENLIKLDQDYDKWIRTLPKAIWDPALDWTGKAPWDNPNSEIFARLPNTLEVVESMVETNRRFQAYQAEVYALIHLGISFQEWLQLAPSTEEKLDGYELMYIIPSKPLEMVVA